MQIAEVVTRQADCGEVKSWTGEPEVNLAIHA
jgi:hypothetical protein